MNYAYTQIEYECVGKMGDRELDDLMQDVAKLVHDREWCLSGDTCDETYMKSVRAFKKKWFEAPRMARLEGYITQACEQARAECLAMLCVKGEAAPDKVVLIQNEYVDKYGEYVDKVTAAGLLNVTRQTVYAMLADGRLQSGYNGKRVSVRSIASYMNMKGGRL